MSWYLVAIVGLSVCVTSLYAGHKGIYVRTSAAATPVKTKAKKPMMTLDENEDKVEMAEDEWQYKSEYSDDDWTIDNDCFVWNYLNLFHS